MKKNFKFDKNYLLYLASLSFLSLSDQEINELIIKLEETRKYIDRINQLDTKKFDPTYQTFKMKNITFKDGVINERLLNSDDIFNNSKANDKKYFITKKII